MIEYCQWKNGLCGGWFVEKYHLYLGILYKDIICSKCGRSPDLEHELKVEKKQKEEHRNWHTNPQDSERESRLRKGNRCRGKHSPIHFVNDEILELPTHILKERFGVSDRAIQEERKRRNNA